MFAPNKGHNLTLMRRQYGRLVNQEIQLDGQLHNVNGSRSLEAIIE